MDDQRKLTEATSIQELAGTGLFSVRAHNVLVDQLACWPEAGRVQNRPTFATIGDLLDAGLLATLRRTKNCGKKTTREIIEVLCDAGLVDKTGERMSPLGTREQISAALLQTWEGVEALEMALKDVTHKTLILKGSFVRVMGLLSEE